MWSRGLGKENLGLCLDDAALKTLDEALAGMPEAARERLLSSLNGSRGRGLTVTGKIAPPVGWEYVIFLDRKDIFCLMKKMLFSRKTLKLFL